jgi:hypothetical protein
MNPKLKNVLLRAAKNAVNASLTALGPIAVWPTQFHIHNWQGLKNILIVMGSAALSRELLVWVPEILRWSQTNANGGSNVKT